MCPIVRLLQSRVVKTARRICSICGGEANSADSLKSRLSLTPDSCEYRVRFLDPISGLVDWVAVTVSIGVV